MALPGTFCFKGHQCLSLSYLRIENEFLTSMDYEKLYHKMIRII